MYNESRIGEDITFYVNDFTLLLESEEVGEPRHIEIVKVLINYTGELLKNNYSTEEVVYIAKEIVY